MRAYATKCYVQIRRCGTRGARSSASQILRNVQASTGRVVRRFRVTRGALGYRCRLEEAAETILERLECLWVTGEGRPTQARTVCELLGRDYGYEESYRAVVLHIRRRYRAPPMRALRRVEEEAGVQGPRDWFEAQVRTQGDATKLSALVVHPPAAKRASRGGP